MFNHRFNNIFINKRFIFNSYNYTKNNFYLKYIINRINNKYNFTYHLYSTTNNTNKLSKSDDLITKNEDSPITFDESEVIKCTKDQWLYKPSAREIKLFLDAKLIPTRPLDLENSIVVKLIDLNKGVSSPVKSTVYYSEYGIRKGERLKLVVIWALVCSLCTYLGIWQLKRRKWKEDLISKRQKSLTLPILKIESLSDIKSVDKSYCESNSIVNSDIESITVSNSNNFNSNSISNQDNSNNNSNTRELEENESNDILYRVIEAKGVLDTKEQFLVGPRQSLTHDYGDQAGYYVLYPLRFRDGSSILVNMGWLKGDDVFDMNVSSEWVTVRGVLVSGEISESIFPSFKHKIYLTIEYLSKRLLDKDLKLTNRINRVSRLIKNDQRKVYRYLDPESIASQLFSTEPELTQKYILNVYDSYFDEDKPLLDSSTNYTTNTSSNNRNISNIDNSISNNNSNEDGIINRLIKVSGIRSLEALTKSKDPLDNTRTSPQRYDFQRKQKSDYLLFYADPGTHFNYAMQWFLMGFSISAMCMYKLVKVNRILKNLNL